jgi:ankyrin repeat protein
MNTDKEYNKYDVDENTPLHHIFRHFNSDKDTAKKLALFLLQGGADNSLKNKNGFTCLH